MRARPSCSPSARRRAPTRQLSIDEIIARHRQYQARLDALVQNYRASARMEQHFRPSLTDPGYDVVTENTYFVSKDGVEFEELSFLGERIEVGRRIGRRSRCCRPRRCCRCRSSCGSSQDYRYTLAGHRARRRGRDCYRVRFEPTREDEALYRGTVWIDRRTFARVKVQAVQTRTSAPIVSNEEIHTYEPVATRRRHSGDADDPADGAADRPDRGAQSPAREAGDVLGLSRATPPTSTQAARRRAAATASCIARPIAACATSSRKASSAWSASVATTRARAMAMGLLVDPSFGYPLPIFGLNILDFEFRGRPDTQFALLFAGVLAAGNIQRPKLGGTPLDASLDFFAIAPPASDRLYVGGGEREDRAAAHVAADDRTQPGMAVHAVSESDAAVPVSLRRLRPRSHDQRERSCRRAARRPTASAARGNTNAAATAWRRTATWFARSQWRPWGPAAALGGRSAAHLRQVCGPPVARFLSRRRSRRCT